VKNKEAYFLQQRWPRLMKMIPSKEEKQNGSCFQQNLDLNNLESKLLKQYLAQFLSSMGAIF